MTLIIRIGYTSQTNLSSSTRGKLIFSVSFNSRSYKTFRPTSNSTCHPLHRGHAILLQASTTTHLDQYVPSYAQGPCCSSSKLDMCVSSLRQSMQRSLRTVQKTPLHFSNCTCHPCAGAVQPRTERRENRHSRAGATIVSSASRGWLLREIRTFGRAVEGSSVSPLTNTMGGLSGGGRGGDTSGAVSAPSFVVARLRDRALALDMTCGTWCPPFVIRKAYGIEGSSAPRRKSSVTR